MPPPTKKGVEQTIRETMEKLSPEAQAVFSRRLERVLTRQKALARFPTPAHLSQFWRKEFYQTPMLDAIDRALMLAEARSQPRWIINTPPQRGKTSRMQDGAAWMLLRNPGLNIVFCSYEQGIAGQSSLAIRQMIETYGSGYRNVKRDPLQEDHLGLLLDPDRAQQTRWSLADVPDGSGRKPGGIAAVGIGGALTGRQADVIIVDDPIKDAKQADSKHARDVVKNWFQSVALTRLSKDGIVIVVQCMTGDTPVLMGDGREKPLRDIRPGDVIATYENNAVTTSVVRNWAPQGPDAIYSIRMKSGRVVRANARHPFLTIENGEHVWRRTDTLKKGSVIQTVIGENGATPAAQQKAADAQSAAKGCVHLTTTNIGGLTDTAPRQLMPSPAETLTSNTDTNSIPENMTPLWKNKGDCAPFAASRLPLVTHEPTGTENSAWITNTPQDAYVACCATTAISPSATENPPPFSAPPLTTYKAEPDEIVEVLPCGVEDVYDIQVDRTENFIANGLVSHNTRWHEDDLSGWLIHNEPDRWEHLNIPAQAIENDPLGRQPGEYLIDARGFEAADWEQVKKDVGGRTWFALYQGNPTPPEGGIFQREWFDNNRVPVAPELNAIRTFIDPADNTGEGDEAGIITAGIGVDGHIYLLSDDSGHYTVAQWFRKAMYALMKHKGTRLAYEKSLSGLKRSMEAEWRTMRNQAIELRDRWRAKFPTDTWSTVPDPIVIDEVVALNSTKDDTIIYKKTLEMQLIEMWPWVPKMMEFSPSGPSIEAVVARGSKTFRAEMVSPLYENGTVRHVGQMPTLEHQMASWLPTQNSPDRMDAAVHIVAKLNSLSRAGAAVAKPTARISRPSPRIGGPYRNR